MKRLASLQVTLMSVLALKGEPGEGLRKQPGIFKLMNHGGRGFSLGKGRSRCFDGGQAVKGLHNTLNRLGTVKGWLGPDIYMLKELLSPNGMGKVRDQHLLWITSDQVM